MLGFLVPGLLCSLWVLLPAAFSQEKAAGCGHLGVFVYMCHQPTLVRKHTGVRLHSGAAVLVG
jgi:hypothetical protein